MEEMITNLEFSNNFWEIFLPLILMVFDTIIMHGKLKKYLVQK